MTRYLKVVVPTLALALAPSLAPSQVAMKETASPVAVAMTSNMVSVQSPTESSSGLPAQTAPPRTLRAHWHVYIAFTATWLLLFGYALSLGRRFGRLEDEIRQASQ